MTKTDLQVYRCRACDNVALASAAADQMTCCGGTLEEVAVDTEIQEPETDRVLREVFGLTDTGMEICLCVMEQEEATVSDIADDVDLDRSAVSRYVNDLVDIGLLEKATRNLKDGGYVHVYRHNPPEEVEEHLTMGFYAWTAEAVKLIDALNSDKMAAMADAEGVEPENAVFHTEED